TNGALRRVACHAGMNSSADRADAHLEEAMSTIAEVETRLFAVPLPEVLTDAKHGDHTHFQLVTTTLRLADGGEGTGYTYTGGKGGHAILAMIQHDLAPALIG